MLTNQLPVLSLLTVAIIVTSIIITLTEFGKLMSAQAQGVAGSLTLEQKDAICNPNNPSAKLTPVNTTESKLCGIPKTLKPHLTSSNMTTGAQAPPAPGTPSKCPTGSSVVNRLCEPSGTTPACPPYAPNLGPAGHFCSTSLDHMGRIKHQVVL
jgi:hypothetical protein